MEWSQNARRWSRILSRTGRAIYEDDCLGWAAELAFFWFLALFPALLFAVALASSLPVQHLLDVVVASLARVAPGDVLVLIRGQLAQIAHQPPRSLLTISLMAALWSSSSAMTAIIDTLNQAYHVKEGRAWWRVRLLAVGLTVVLMAFLLTAVTLLMMGPALADALERSLALSWRFTWVWAVVEWPIVFGIVVTALGWVYHFAPDLRRPWTWFTPGAVAATLLWILASLGFKWYASHVGDLRGDRRRHRHAPLALRVGLVDPRRRGVQRRQRVWRGAAREHGDGAYFLPMIRTPAPTTASATPAHSGTLTRSFSWTENSTGPTLTSCVCRV
jgi:membrane protein